MGPRRIPITKPMYVCCFYVSLRQTTHLKVSVMLETATTCAFVAAKVDEGGCHSASATGVFFWICSEGYWNVTSDLGEYCTFLVFRNLLELSVLFSSLLSSCCFQLHRQSIPYFCDQTPRLLFISSHDFPWPLFEGGY